MKTGCHAASGLRQPKGRASGAAAVPSVGPCASTGLGTWGSSHGGARTAIACCSQWVRTHLRRGQSAQAAEMGRWGCTAAGGAHGGGFGTLVQHLPGSLASGPQLMRVTAAASASSPIQRRMHSRTLPAPQSWNSSCRLCSRCHAPHFCLAMRATALRRGQSGQALATGRPGCTHEDFSHTACTAGSHEAGAAVRPCARRTLAAPPQLQLRRLHGCGQATLRLHCASTRAASPAHRLQRRADELGLGRRGSGGAHDHGAATGRGRRLGALGSQQGCLERGQHSVSRRGRAAAAARPGTSCTGLRTAPWEGRGAPLWQRHPPPPVWRAAQDTQDVQRFRAGPLIAEAQMIT